MNTLDLRAMGLEEMNEQELLTVEGGSIFGTIWRGISSAASAVGNAVVDSIRWILAHQIPDANGTGASYPL